MLSAPICKAGESCLAVRAPQGIITREVTAALLALGQLRIVVDRRVDDQGMKVPAAVSIVGLAEACMETFHAKTFFAGVTDRHYGYPSRCYTPRIV